MGATTKLMGVIVALGITSTIGSLVRSVQAAPPTTQAELWATRWAAVDSSLKQCRTALQKAPTVNQGGYVEKAIEDANRTIADAAAAAAKAPAYIDDRTGFGSATKEIIATSIQYEIDSVGRTNGRGLGPDMVAALRALKAATDGIGRLPALGNRDIVVRDIGRLATDFTSAKSVLNGGSPTVTRTPVANAKGDTTTTSGSLTAIQGALNDSIASLRKETGSHGGLVEETIAEENHALADVARALEFVKAHPNLDTLMVPAASGVSPMAEVSPQPYVEDKLNDFGLSIRERGAPPSANGPQVALYPNISQGMFYLNTSLDVALHTFLNHPDGQIEMDAYDNAIITDLTTAISNAIRAIDYVDGPFAGHAGLSHNTTLGHLAVAQRSIKEAIASIQKDPAASYGGRAEQAVADIQKAMSDIDKAVAFVQAHPAIDALQMIPTPNGGSRGPSTTNPPAYARIEFPNMVTAVNSLNTAIKEFMNISTQSSMPLLGDIGGSRDVLMTDINTSARDIVAAMDYAHTHVR